MEKTNFLCVGYDLVHIKYKIIIFRYGGQIRMYIIVKVCNIQNVVLVQYFGYDMEEVFWFELNPRNAFV